MQRRARWILGSVAAGIIASGAVGGVAIAGPTGESDAPITGAALEKASAVALAHVGGGKVTDTEIGDEDSYYEVEVTRPDGSQVDVQLDEQFAVVGTNADTPDGAGS
ncbi:PepSY domain-containing protein [Dactylosporangium sp. NPDC005572]|uniref:PepSY domain-containing protein n=1 Tax=Dactylosporangium sp. NPDC005572 TaxID=3156889 RepID=UPI0033A7DCB2